MNKYKLGRQVVDIIVRTLNNIAQWRVNSVKIVWLWLIFESLTRNT